MVTEMTGLDNWKIPSEFYKDETTKHWSHCAEPFSDESFSFWFTRTAKMNCADTLPLFYKLTTNKNDFSDIERNDDVKQALVMSLEPFLEMKSLKLGNKFSVQSIERGENEVDYLITPLRTPRYCPLCFSEDREPYFRSIWQLSFVTVCPTHHVLLFDHCSSCFNKIQYWKTKWNQGINSCFKCRENLGDNYSFIPRHRDPDDVRFQQDLLVIYKTGIQQDEKVNITTFFRNLWRLASTESPVQAVVDDDRDFTTERVFKAISTAYKKITQKPGDFLTGCNRTGQESKVFANDEGMQNAVLDITEKELDVAESRYRIIQSYIKCANKSAKEARRRANEEGIGLSTFYTWIGLYKKSGLHGLAPRHRDSGRPRGFSSEMESLIEACIKENISKPVPDTQINCWKRFKELTSNLGYEIVEIPSRCTFRSRYLEYLDDQD